MDTSECLLISELLSIADRGMDNPFVNVYPNPTNSSFSVEFESDPNFAYTFVVSTLQGVIVKSGKLQGSGVTEINIEMLQAGCYLFQLINPDYSTRPILIMKL